MSISAYILAIFLILGLLGVPSSVFAQESGVSSDDTLRNSLPVFKLNALNPQLKGGGGGGKGGGGGRSSRSRSSSSRTGTSSDGNSTGVWDWIYMIIIYIIIPLAVVVGLWKINQ